jgi:hypothetical protein
VKDQDIITATQEKTNVNIELTTNITNAVISQTVVVNNATATAEADIQKNQAEMESFYNIVTQQAEAYAKLAESLGLTDE